MKLVQFIAVFIGIFFGAVSNLHAAVCQPDPINPTNDGSGYYILKDNLFLGFTIPSNINDLAIGQRFDSKTLRPQVINATVIPNPRMTCVGGAPEYSYDGVGAGPGRIYQSSVAGVGLRMSMTGDVAKGNIPATGMSRGGGVYYLEAPSRIITIEFIRTGRVSTNLSDLVLRGVFLELRLDGVLAAQYRFDDVQLIPTNPTCRVKAGKETQDVPLGRHALSHFTGQGTTTARVPFSIDLSCSGGDPNTRVKPWVTLSGTTDTQSPLVLALTGSRVQGIGVEVLRNGVAVGFGSNNRWEAGEVAQGTTEFRIELEARYRQIRNTVTGGGAANASATFTIDYQ